MALAKQMLDEAFGEKREEWLQRMAAELPQIQLVFEWLQAPRKVEQGLRLAYFLQEIWFERPYSEEGLAHIQTFLEMSDEASSWRATCLDPAGAIAMFMDNLELAAALKAEGIAILRTLGNQAQPGSALVHQGHLAGMGQGHYKEAEKLYRESLSIFTEIGDKWGVAHAMSNLAGVLLELGDYGSARRFVNEALQRYVELDSEWDMAVTLGRAAGVAAVHGEFERAVHLAAASQAHRERIGLSLPNSFQKRFKRFEAMALAGLDEEQGAASWAAGQTMAIERAVAFALEGTSGM